MNNVWCRNIGKNIGLAETMFYLMFWLKKSKNHCSELPNMVNITKFCGKTYKMFCGMFWAKNIGQCPQCYCSFILYLMKKYLQNTYKFHTYYDSQIQILD